MTFWDAVWSIFKYEFALAFGFALGMGFAAIVFVSGGKDIE